MSSKIIRVYLLGAIVLVSLYSIVFYNAILYTENQSSMKRLSLIAPFYLKIYSQGEQGIVEVNPTLKAYDSYELLPKNLQEVIAPNWQGSEHFQFSDDSEYSVHALEVITEKGLAIAYAVEDVDAIEWKDQDFAAAQLLIASFGLFAFLIAAFFIVKMAKRISKPFTSLAEQLSNDQLTNVQLHSKTRQGSQPIEINGELSEELLLLLGSVNNYRSCIDEAFEKERAFSRYISHELRTPMTVIRGSVELLNRIDNPRAHKQAKRISDAVTQMEGLTRIFLLLAKSNDEQSVVCYVDEAFVDDIVKDFESNILANQVSFESQLTEDFTLNAEPVLLAAIIKNLLKNAINCSVEGRVSLYICPQEIVVIDNGVGLNAQPRGYEGFGIGLNIVKDICTKYGWEFSIINNIDKGCSATVRF